MTEADRQLAQLLRDNPELRVIPERGTAPTPAQQATRQAAVRAIVGEPSEADMQAAVITWAEANTDKYPALRWLFHVPNGGYRHPATAAQMHAQGVKAGVPDLLLPVRTWAAYGLAIEMKRKPNKPTPEQVAWLAHLDSEGWQTHVCYSAEEAIAVLREYLGIA